MDKSENQGLQVLQLAIGPVLSKSPLSHKFGKHSLSYKFFTKIAIFCNSHNFLQFFVKFIVSVEPVQLQINKFKLTNITKLM